MRSAAKERVATELPPYALRGTTPTGAAVSRTATRYQNLPPPRQVQGGKGPGIRSDSGRGSAADQDLRDAGRSRASSSPRARTSSSEKRSRKLSRSSEAYVP